ncbi:MAG: hypothetical protein ACRD3B_04575 [Candidatus Sulfotelmatobacter sp.]
MQTLFADAKKTSVLGSGLGMVMRNKRYIFWFWLLDLTLSEFGTSAFRQSAHAIMDHSLYAGRLVHGFDIGVMIELFARPEFGSMQAARMPALYFSIIFFLFTALFLPGVFQGYASTYRLPRTDFFRACGRNLWRFIRLLFVAGIVMGVVAGILFGINGAIDKKAVESTNELLPFTLQMIGLGVIFLVMSTLRIWFDLTEVTMVLDDKGVWRSLGPSFRQTFRSLGRLLGSYVMITIVAAAILIGGILTWATLVKPESVVGAFLVSQITLLLLLIPRFWQRGVAVSYWQQYMLMPVAVVAPVVPPPVAAVAVEPAPPVVVLPPPEPATS